MAAWEFLIRLSGIRGGIVDSYGESAPDGSGALPALSAALIELIEAAAGTVDFQRAGIRTWESEQ